MNHDHASASLAPNFMPHGHCYAWTPGILGMEVGANAVIALAYFSIPVILWAFVLRRPDIPYRHFLTLFAVFITSCGVGHLLEVVAIWQPIYWQMALWNCFTAVASIGTAIALVPVLPRLLKAGTLEEYLQRQAIVKLEAEVSARTEDLEREKAFMERLVRHVPAGIAYMDRDLVVRWFNPAYHQYLSGDPGRYIDRPLFEVAPQVRDRIGPLLDHVLDSGEPTLVPGYTYDRVVEGVTSQVVMDVSYVPVTNRHGQTEGILVVVQDATERAQRERLQAAQIAKLEELDRYKDEFLSVISHEMRTPLNFIMGFASLMDEGLAGPISPTHKQYVGRIMAGAERMLALVNDLLDYAKLRAGKVELAIAEVAYAPLVDEVVATLAPLAAPRGLTILAAVDVDVPLGADGPRVVQVVSNLIGNAIKFCTDGTITVRARVTDGAVLTEVADTGPGIAPEDLPRLFNRFEQLDMGETRAAGGTGLGLAIVKELVEAHGGTVGVSSVPGEGTTFWFTLPLAPSGGA
ncbi:MAG: ATP-binding protein, partial [Candidatus Sericytochromatia bacterium]